MSETPQAVESTAPRRHAYTGPEQPQVPEPSYAERVRTLISRIDTGMLSTLSRRHPGFPFGSLMPFALDAAGCPLFLISTMAMHTQNLKADDRASLFLAQIAVGEDPLGTARATLVGQVEPVPPAELAEARVCYLARHENSRYWADFADFGFFRLRPADVYYVGGFGVMGWVTAEEYGRAEPDPLAPAAAGIVAHMNADHVLAMVQLAKAFAGMDATEAAMTSVDRLGFSLRLQTAEGTKGARINYPREARTAAEVRTQLVQMTRDASGSGTATQPKVVNPTEPSTL